MYSPVRHLVGFVRRLDKPDVKNVQPLWEELDLKQMRKDGWSEKRMHQILLPRIDYEVFPKTDAQFRNDILQDKLVPLA
jgi:hypothetical protein